MSLPLHMVTWLFLPSVSGKSGQVVIRISVWRDIVWFGLLDFMLIPGRGQALFETLGQGKQNLKFWPTSCPVWFLLQAAVFFHFHFLPMSSLIPEPIVFLCSGLNEKCSPTVSGTSTHGPQLVALFGEVWLPCWWKHVTGSGV